jgi:prolipoprotein diacylglyceryltransferase
MYPGISDLINDFFGTNFQSSFPPSFGTLVAISFLLAAWTLGLELKRRERNGILQPMMRTVVTGKGASAGELIWNGFFGFLLGFKIVYAFIHSDAFFSNPQQIILSADGNWPAGIILSIVFVIWKYKEKEKQQTTPPKVIQEAVYPHQIVSEITMAAAIGGLLGAKVFHLLEYWSDFIADPAGMFFSGSGLTMYGGLIVGGATVIWYGKKNNIPPLHLCDATAPGLMLAYGTGRLGCQLSGDGDWGIVNNSPKPSVLNFLPDWVWSYKYPHNVVNEGVPIDGCVGKHCYELPEGVFPTPLYESVTCIALFFVLWAMRKKIKVPGLLFSWFLIFNGIERFLIEGIRVNSKYHIGGLAFSQAQLISLLLLVTGLAGIFYFNKQKKKYESI